MLAALATLEKTGERWWNKFAGVLIIEAEKQIYAGNPTEVLQKATSKPIIVGTQRTDHSRVKT